MIDNDPSCLEFLENLIFKIRPNVQCISFVFADEAVETVCNQFATVPQYIFINANLKRTTGTRCLSTFRSNSKFDSCSVGIFSTCMPDAVADTYKSMGADFAFQRPLSVAEGQAILGDILRDSPAIPGVA